VVGRPQVAGDALISLEFHPAVTPHPDFQDSSHTLWNIWSGQNTNVPGEFRNFHDQNNDVSDNWSPYFHGTLVASIIGARGNNGLGMSGVAWNVSLMILKVLGSCGTFAGCSGSQQEAFSSNVSGAIAYASRYHATAINCSFFGNWTDKDGFQGHDPVVADATATAGEEGGMLVVAAAVNAGNNNDDNTYVNTPAMLPLDNVISVGATTIDDQKAPYSNYGPYRVAQRRRHRSGEQRHLDRHRWSIRILHQSPFDRTDSFRKRS